MRTKEEAKFELDQNIFELYDRGIKVKVIARRLHIKEDYVLSLLSHPSIEGMHT